MIGYNDYVNNNGSKSVFQGVVYKTYNNGYPLLSTKSRLVL